MKSEMYQLIKKLTGINVAFVSKIVIQILKGAQ